MRVLIVVLLALAVDATNYGWSSYGGSPSYSYGGYGGGYGSSLYGASYGSGSGWGSSYGSGGWGGSGYSSYSPASYQTARYEQPQSIKTAYQTEYTADEVPKSIAFTLGGANYQAGTSDVSGHQEWQAPVTVSRQSYQQPHSTGAVYQSGAAPGSIAFTLGGTGYQTGTSGGVSGYQGWKAPAAVSRPAAVYSQRTASIPRSGTQGAVTPAKITFNQYFSRVSGGSDGISAHRTIAPAAVVTEKHSYQQPQITRTSYQSGGYSSGAAPGNIAFTLGGAGYQTGTSGVTGHQEWKAPVAVTRQSYQRPQRARTTYQSGGYSSGAAPGNIAFTLGGAGYQTGTLGVSGHQEWKTPVSVTRQSYQRPQITRTTYQSGGYSSGAAPGNIAFTLGGTGYQTGTSGVSGYQEWKAPVAVPRPAAVVSHRTTAVRRTGVHGATAGVAPAKITFTQDFSRVSGQSGGVHRSGGISGVSAFKKAVAPAVVVTEKHTGSFGIGGTGSLGGHGATGVSGIHFQEIAGVGGGHVSGGHISSAGYKKVISPAAVSVPKRTRVTGSAHRSGAIGTVSAQPHITFTQDFSKVTGHTGTAAIRPEIHTYDRVVTPVRPAVAPRQSYQRPQITRTTYQSGGYSSGAAPGNIAFTLGGTGYQTGTSGVSSYQEWKAPVAVSRVPARASGAIRQSGFLGTTIARPQIRYTQGVSGHTQQFVRKPETIHYEKVSAPVVTHRTSGHRVAGGQGFSAAGPAKITFTQDFSKVTGHQTARVKPVVSTHNKLSVSEFPGVVATDIYQGHRTNVIAAPKPVVKVQYKAPKRPVVTQEPALTTIYDSAPVREAVVDKTVYVSPTGPANTADYKQEIATVVGGQGVDKQSTVYYVPGSEVVHEKSSSYKYSPAVGGQSGGDVSNRFVVIPSERSVLLQSAGAIPAGGFAEEKGVVYHTTSGNLGADNQNLGGYSAISTPFKSYYTSSYPGYSHVSGESPRYDFSSDRNLLYSYSSPYMVSPFSYTYSSGKSQYNQVYKKA